MCGSGTWFLFLESESAGCAALPGSSPHPILRFQIMVVSPTASIEGLDRAQELLFDFADPDMNVAMVNVPQAPLVTCRSPLSSPLPPWRTWLTLPAYFSSRRAS